MRRKHEARPDSAEKTVRDRLTMARVGIAELLRGPLAQTGATAGWRKKD